MVGRRERKGHFREEKVPTNPRLWKMVVKRAQMRFTPYPSLPASHWIHNEYVKQGGQFIKQQTNTESRKERRKTEREEDRKTPKTRVTREQESKDKKSDNAKKKKAK